MTLRNPRTRRVARDAARLAAAVSACMLVLAVVAAVTGTAPASAAVEADRATVMDPTGTNPLTTGGSATPFSVKLPTAAACEGDSAVGNYRVQSFIVPASVDPATIRYGANGPTPAGTGAALAQPLFSTTSAPYANGLTDVAVEPGGPGTISGLPQFSFAVFEDQGATVVPPGTYLVGIACTLGNETAPEQVDRYWAVELTVVADPADEPGGFTWTAAEATLPTTPTTPPDETTTTTAPGETTTTTAGGPTTTAPGSTTTTGPAVVAGSGFTGGDPSAASPVTTFGQLPFTGTSTTTTLLCWAVALVVFGRMAVLLGRTPKVIPGPTG